VVLRPESEVSGGVEVRGIFGVSQLRGLQAHMTVSYADCSALMGSAAEDSVGGQIETDVAFS
jgi:hypothetical protein